MSGRPEQQPIVVADETEVLTPAAFATLLAQMMSAYGRMFDGESNATRDFEVKRRQVIDVYERACAQLHPRR